MKTIFFTKVFINGLLEGQTFNDMLKHASARDVAYYQQLEAQQSVVPAIFGTSDYLVTDVRIEA